MLSNYSNTSLIKQVFSNASHRKKCENHWVHQKNFFGHEDLFASCFPNERQGFCRNLIDNEFSPILILQPFHELLPNSSTVLILQPFHELLPNNMRLFATWKLLDVLGGQLFFILNRGNDLRQGCMVALRIFSWN